LPRVYASGVRLPATPGASMTSFERFFARVIKPDGCWLWAGSLNNVGYPTFWPTSEKKVLAHRFAYELFVGPIPEGLTLDHLCKKPRCVRPDHLEPVTIQENLSRNMKDACVRGHPFSGKNLYVRPNGRRTCRECRDAKAKAKANRASKRPPLPLSVDGCHACEFVRTACSVHRAAP
jgi:hypothetical protein